MRNQYKKLFNDSLIFAIGSFGSKLITFFLVGFYTYYLTKSEYGTADLLLNTINLALPIVSLSVSEGVLRFVLDSKSQQEKLDWLRTALGTNVMGLGGLALLLGGLRLFGLRVDLSSGVGLLSFCLLTIQSFQLILMQYIKAIGKLKTYAANGILLSLFTLLFNLLLFRRMENMIVAYFLSLVVANLFSLVFLAVNISWRALLTRRKTVNSEQRKQLIAYSLPLIPNSAMWWILTTSSRFIMTFFLVWQVTGCMRRLVRFRTYCPLSERSFYRRGSCRRLNSITKKRRRPFIKRCLTITARCCCCSPD